MSVHISVLMNEVIEGLDIKEGDTIVDGTINGGGHAYEISKNLDEKGTLIGIDQDINGLNESEKRLSDATCGVRLVHDNTRNLNDILENLSIDSIDKILLDLGWSSNQFENPERGFSFMHDGPLTMTLADDSSQAPFTAYDIVNDWSEESLTDIIKGYGEERFTGRIVRAITEARAIKPINSTLELADIIKNAVPGKFKNGRIHPATQTFQALRIAVNDEMGALKEILESSFEKLSKGGRMVIISFHSIEDRIVKKFYREQKNNGSARILTKKPITATDEELLENKRSRSAKLRILEKI
ncbi:MAG: 16S rRNA (cytosine(1402)-N(4))-methyltransferase RsmH [Candidatus Pacebacteria bacterium]|nr:16S rRNA (cytosine(1402)-N(4))-methyltransferase RsmH [Candidatus Paceibacterota bacterium]